MANLQLESLQDRWLGLKTKVKAAAERSGREMNDVVILAVTKNVQCEIVAQAITLGMTEIGENRVQEALEKIENLKSRGKSGSLNLNGVHFHMIGHLQSNKARKSVANFDVIQSVDHPDLAADLNRLAGEEGKKQRCLIEVKISPEPSKSGISQQEAPAFIEGFGQYQNLKLEGLMTIPPFGITPEKTREYFREFKVFFERQKKFLGENPVLSMGMTDDFEIAIEEGSTMIRVGRALFGERKRQD